MSENINKTALLVVDAQNDFVKGTLPVPGAEETIPTINHIIADAEAKGMPIIYTRDWHPPNHMSFEQWPVHCVVGTWGAQFVDELNFTDGFTLEKGKDKLVEQYSAFAPKSENGEGRLHSLLQAYDIDHVWIIGFATEYCIHSTATYALAHEYKVTIFEDAIAAVDPEKGEEVLKSLREQGVLTMSCKIPQGL